MNDSSVNCQSRDRLFRRKANPRWITKKVLYLLKSQYLQVFLFFFLRKLLKFVKKVNKNLSERKTRKTNLSYVLNLILLSPRYVLSD